MEPLPLKRRRERPRRVRRRRYGVTVPIVVWVRANGICQLCGLGVTPEEASIDHIVPLLYGGEHSLENFQLAHRECNNAKGAQYEEGEAIAA